MGECLIGTGRTGSSGNVPVNTTYFYPLGMANAATTYTTEDPANANMPVAGVLSQLCIRVGTNTFTSATSTFSSRKNGAAGNQLVSIAAGLTGLFLDAVNIDNLAANDDFATQLTTLNIGSGVMSFTMLTASFTGTADHTTVLAASIQETTSANNQSRFFGLYGANVATVTSTAPEVQIDRACTARNLSVYIDSNARTTDTTARFRKNNGNGTMNFSIGAGLTGWFSDTTNTDSIAQDDKIAASLVLGASSEVISLQYFGVILTSTENNAPIIAGVQGGLARTASATQHFYLPVGQISSNQTGEGTQQMQKNFACKVRNMKINVISSTTTGDATMQFRVNGGNGNQTLTIGAGLTGIFEDAVNVDQLVGTDDFCYSLVGGTSGSFNYRYMSSSMGVPATIRQYAYLF